MSIHRTSKSGLFLLEMVILILFFSIASAVCVNLFVKAHLISGQNRDLNEAVRQVQTAAETYKAVDGDPARLQELLSVEEQDGVYEAWFAKDWTPLSSGEGAAYVLVLAPGEAENGLIRARAAVLKAAPDQEGAYEEIYGVDVKKYLG